MRRVGAARHNHPGLVEKRVMKFLFFFVFGGFVIVLFFSFLAFGGKQLLGVLFFDCRDVVFFCEILHVDIVAAGDEAFISQLLLGGVGSAFVPLEMVAFHWESMLEHLWQQLPVDDVAQEGGVFVDEVLEHAFVYFALGVRRAVVHGHGNGEDAFGELAVATLDATVVDVVSVATCGFFDVDGGAFGEECVGCRSHSFEHFFDFVLLLL